MVAIGGWSEHHYGIAHATNYEDLIWQALDDLVADPTRPGSARVRRYPGVRDYPIRHSAPNRPREQRIRAPWHKIVYREQPDGIVEILAVVGLSYPSGRSARAAIGDPAVGMGLRNR
jgi:hypothetical protein